MGSPELRVGNFYCDECQDPESVAAELYRIAPVLGFLLSRVHGGRGEDRWSLGPASDAIEMAHLPHKRFLEVSRGDENDRAKVKAFYSAFDELADKWLHGERLACQTSLYMFDRLHNQVEHYHPSNPSYLLDHIEDHESDKLWEWLSGESDDDEPPSKRGRQQGDEPNPLTSDTWTSPGRRMCKFSDIDPTARLVGLVMAAHADNQGNGIYVSQTTLSDITGLTVRTIRNAQRKLEDAGAIIRKRDHRQHMPPLWSIGDHQ